ncbi:TPA: type II toxin-antitoxin system antitoxin SocA domain-containing protein [Vibrio parahaemolyticus]
MQTNLELENLIQYVILRAGEEDDYTLRSLGPIHLIKYVYLADLYYSEKLGQTYTGINWKFYNFGPWSTEVHSSLSPALSKIMANKVCLESLYSEEDSIRWNLRDSDLLNRKSREIPASITARLSRDIHKFTSNTSELLNHVYKTAPMLKATPNSTLEFEKSSSQSYEPLSTRKAALSNKKTKKLAQKLAELRKSHAENFQQEQLVSPVKKPRIDEVYMKGVEWLEQLAGEQTLEQEIVVEFSDNVWQSTARSDYELS